MHARGKTVSSTSILVPTYVLLVVAASCSYSLPVLDLVYNIYMRYAYVNLITWLGDAALRIILDTRQLLSQA